MIGSLQNRPATFESSADTSLTLASRLGMQLTIGARPPPPQPASDVPPPPKSKPVKKDIRGKADPNLARANRQSSARPRIPANALSSIKGSASRTNSTKSSRVPYSKPPPQAETAIDVLRKLIEARYDHVIKFLDLSNLAGDRILKAGGIAPPGEKGAPTRTASAIWKLCQEKYPNVRSLSLANNNLSTLRPMAIGVLVSTFPNLEQVSLAGNRLTSFSELNAFSVTVGGTAPSSDSQKSGLNNLRELNLKGNPFRSRVDKEAGFGHHEYQFEACRRFPALRVLDGEPIDPIIRSQISGLPNRSAPPKPLNARQTLIGPEPSLPLSIKPAFYDNESTSSVISSFFLKFFTAHDQDRSLLLDVYANDASFSLSGSFSIPVRAKCAGLTRNSKEMPAQEVVAWQEYNVMSRNMARLKGHKLGERIAYGPAEIMQHLNKIPRTKHSMEDSRKFVVDGWQMPSMLSGSDSGIIYATIHGAFQELPSLTFRSFDRTFILGAASPASAAALKGWPCVILSDQLTVRSYSSPTAWETSSLTAEQDQMVEQLMRVTNLKPALALECLVQNGWQPVKALENFESLKATGGLPPDAFELL